MAKKSSWIIIPDKVSEGLHIQMVFGLLKITEVRLMAWLGLSLHIYWKCLQSSQICLLVALKEERSLTWCKQQVLSSTVGWLLDISVELSGNESRIQMSCTASVVCERPSPNAIWRSCSVKRRLCLLHVFTLSLQAYPGRRLASLSQTQSCRNLP